MAKRYVIEGGTRLEGTTYVSGSKNASLPILASTILNGKGNKLYNVPNIHDTQMMLKILEYVGCKVKKSHDKISIDSSNIHSEQIPENLMGQMRSSVIMAGALLARKKKVRFTYPGDYDIWWIHLPIVHYVVNGKEYRVSGPEYKSYKIITTTNSLFIVIIPAFFLCIIIISQAIARLIQIGNRKNWKNITSKIFTYTSVVMHIFLFLIFLFDFGLNIRKSNIFLVLAVLLTSISIVIFIKTIRNINKFND